MLHRLPVVLVAIAVIVTLGAIAWSLPLSEWLQWLRHWIHNLGIWGVAAFVVLYSVVTILMGPVLPLTVTAGLVYGAWGFPLALVSATNAACLGFFISRYFIHDRIEKAMQGNLMFHAIRQAVSSNGWKITLLVRLSPILPFAVQNYLLGITDIRFYQYSIATFVGMMPACALYVYLGTLGTTLQRGAWQWALLGAGAIATVAVFRIVVLTTRKALMQLENEYRQP